jgi:hypothetical protein
MNVRLPPLTHPALVGLQVPTPAGPAQAVPSSTVAGPRASLQAEPLAGLRLGLSFEGWDGPIAAPTVFGERAYPGSAADPSAVADAIVGLLSDGA